MGVAQSCAASRSLRWRTERLRASRPADQARAPVAVGERHRQPPTSVTDERVQLLTRLRPEFHERHIKTHCGGALTANFAAIASRSRSVTAWSPGCSRCKRDSLGLPVRQHTAAESANRASAQRFLFFCATRRPVIADGRTGIHSERGGFRSGDARL